MARLLFSASTTTAHASTAAGKSILRVKASTNQRVALRGWSIDFNGTSPTAPAVRVSLVRETGDGTYTAVNERKNDDDIATSIRSVCGENASTNGGTGDVLEEHEVHPQSGKQVFYPFGQEPIIGAGDRLAIRAKSANLETCSATLFLEE